MVDSVMIVTITTPDSEAVDSDFDSVIMITENS